jgi:hypothetical protein
MEAYLINMDSRPDRWEESQHLPFKLNRVSAISHQYGWMGLNLTMHQLFTEKFTGEPMLVFEDDAQWVRPKEHFDKAIADLPEDYDMLLLGANIKGTVTHHTENIYKVDGAWTTHAVLYSADFIRELTPILPTLEIPIDEYFRTVIHPRMKSYVCRPMVCYQRPSFSDIEGTHHDYTKLFDISNGLMF